MLANEIKMLRLPITQLGIT